MNRIEFIGASYVGKSTLYNALSKVVKNDDLYIMEEDCRGLLQKRMGYFIFIYKKIIQKIIVLLGGDFNVYDSTKIESLTNVTLNKYSKSLELCFEREILLEKGISFCNKTYLFLLNLIARYQVYQKMVPAKSIIVEESFIHWHLVYHELFKNKTVDINNCEYSDIGLFPKAIIVCSTTSDTIIERIKLREKSNMINRNHLDKSESEILHHVLEKQDFFLKHAALAQSAGVKVLFVDTADLIDNNVTKIQEFLKSIKN